MTSGPVETVISTVLPGASTEPGEGLWLMTVPASCGLAAVTSVTTYWNSCSVATASSRRLPITLGTVSAVPELTRSVTTELGSTRSPGGGFWANTWLTGTSSLVSNSTSGWARPASSRSSRASWTSRPSTLGTSTTSTTTSSGVLSSSPPRASRNEANRKPRITMSTPSEASRATVRQMPPPRGGSS